MPLHFVVRVLATASLAAVGPALVAAPVLAGRPPAVVGGVGAAPDGGITW